MIGWENRPPGGDAKGQADRHDDEHGLQDQLGRDFSLFMPIARRTPISYFRSRTTSEEEDEQDGGAQRQDHAEEDQRDGAHLLHGLHKGVVGDGIGAQLLSIQRPAA